MRKIFLLLAVLLASCGVDYEQEYIQLPAIIKANDPLYEAYHICDAISFPYKTQAQSRKFMAELNERFVGRKTFVLGLVEEAYIIEMDAPIPDFAYLILIAPETETRIKVEEISPKAAADTPWLEAVKITGIYDEVDCYSRSISITADKIQRVQF